MKLISYLDYDRLLRIDLIQNQNTVEAGILTPEQIIDNLLNKEKGKCIKYLRRK